VGTGDNSEEPLGKIAGIYRVNSDGTIEALESARVEAAEKASLFSTDEGIVVVIGRPASPAGPWPPTTRVRSNECRTRRRSAASSASSVWRSCSPTAPGIRCRRGVLAAPGVRHPLRSGLRDFVHRRLPAGRPLRRSARNQSSHVQLVSLILWLPAVGCRAGSFTPPVSPVCDSGRWAMSRNVGKAASETGIGSSKASTR
jgi:hypothetical protein